MVSNSNNPLVSIIVATYNSSATIIETLDSIYDQTYNNIELIITDDNSKDNTCDKVSEWLEKKSDRFFCSILCTSSFNTGVSGNLNRGLAKAHGTWIKPLGGDDMLFPNYLDKVLSNAVNVDMVATQLYLFKNEKEIIEKGTDLSFLNNKSSKQIAKYYARIHPFFNVPSLIIRKSVYEKIGLYDERSPYFEDVPFLMNFFKFGLKACFLKDVLVWYRVGGVSHQDDFEKAILGNKRLLDVCRLCIYANLDRFNLIDMLVALDQAIWAFSLTRKKVLLYNLYCSRYNILKTFIKWISLKSLLRS